MKSTWLHMQNPVAKRTWKLFKARKWQASFCKLCVMLSLQSSLMQVFVVGSFKLRKISTVLQVMLKEREKSNVQPADRSTFRVSPWLLQSLVPKWNNWIYSTFSKHLNPTADEDISKPCSFPQTDRRLLHLPDICFLITRKRLQAGTEIVIPNTGQKL